MRSAPLRSAVALLAVLLLLTACGGSSGGGSGSGAAASGATGSIDPNLMVLQSTVQRHIAKGDYASAIAYMNRLDMPAVADPSRPGRGVASGYWVVMEGGEPVIPGVVTGIDPSDPFADAEMAVMLRGTWTIPGATGATGTSESAQWHALARQKAEEYNTLLAGTASP